MMMGNLEYALIDRILGGAVTLVGYGIYHYLRKIHADISKIRAAQRTSDTMFFWLLRELHPNQQDIINQALIKYAAGDKPNGHAKQL